MKLRDLAAGKVNASGWYNPGFMIVKPTLASRVVYRMMTEKRRANLREQIRLNKVLGELRERNFRINATHLSIAQYMDGWAYFQHRTQSIPEADDPCSGNDKTKCSVIVVHNNCIYSKEAKIYRFREHLMWFYDGKDKYYSSETRKYITYMNPKPTMFLKQEQLVKFQVAALRTALAIGYLLNRIVLLPKFYCRHRKLYACALHSFIRIKRFEAFFSGRYRENSFLRHPRVPDVVKHSRKYLPLASYSTPSSSTNSMYAVTSDNISRLYKGLKESLINCGTLENIQFVFTNNSTGSVFQRKASKAFELTDYSQRKSGKFV